MIRNWDNFKTFETSLKPQDDCLYPLEINKIGCPPVQVGNVTEQFDKKFIPVSGFTANLFDIEYDSGVYNTLKTLPEYDNYCPNA